MAAKGTRRHAGLAVLVLRRLDGGLDAIVFATFNKQAMHLGGSPFPDELHFMADRLQWKGHVSETNVLDDLWTSRVTSHIGLRQVSALITRQGVHDAIALVDGVLRGSGVKAPAWQWRPSTPTAERVACRIARHQGAAHTEEGTGTAS